MKKILSASYYAKGFFQAGNGTLAEGCKRGCKVEPLPYFLWPLVFVVARRIIKTALAGKDGGR